MTKERTGKAPGQLGIVQAFINTCDVELDLDELDSVAALRAWLVDHSLLREDAVVTEPERQYALAVREALRRALLSNNGGPVQLVTLETLTGATRLAPLHVEFRQNGAIHLTSGDDTCAGAVSALLAIIVVAAAEGTWARLKVCRNPECRWVFYDHSKNRSGTWCSMAICGNRVKARKYRLRHQHDHNVIRIHG